MLTQTIYESLGNVKARIGLATAASDGMMSAGQFVQLAALSAVEHKLDATTDPGASDDADAGYSVRSLWLNTATSEYWRCADATNGSAVWLQTTLTIDELGALAVLDTVGTSQIDDGAVTLPKRSEVDLGPVTGWIDGGQVTINTDAAKVDISAGSALIVNYSVDSGDPVVTRLEWTSQAAIAANLGSSRTKWCAVYDSGGGTAAFEFATSFDSLARRSRAILCRVRSNASDGNITNIDDYERPAWGLTRAFQDYILERGSFNISGNELSANGSNLLLDKAAGSLWRYHATDTYGHENIHDEPLVTARSAYAYHLQGSNATTIEAAIDPGNYDSGGTKTAVPANDWTAQRVYYFPVSGTWHVVYGQATYAKKIDALNALSSEGVVINAEILDGAVWLGSVVVQEGATDLSNPAQCVVWNNPGLSGGGSVAALSSTDDLPEGTSNLYHTDARAVSAYDAATAIVSQADAEAGTSQTVQRWTPERVGQAVAALSSPGDILTGPFSENDWVLLGTWTPATSADGEALSITLFAEVAHPATFDLTVNAAQEPVPVVCRLGQLTGSHFVSEGKVIETASGVYQLWVKLNAFGAVTSLSLLWGERIGGTFAASGSKQTAEPTGTEKATTRIDRIAIVQDLTGDYIPRMHGAGLMRDSGLSDDGTTITASRKISAPDLVIDDAAGGYRTLQWESSGSNRWGLAASSAAESGSDAGSDLVLSAYGDSGSLIDNPLIVSRAAGGAITANRKIAADGGIDFGDSALLDHYEEGTFSPYFAGETTAGAFVYSTQVGQYTRIGNRVFFVLYLHASSVTTAPVGDMRVQGLPYAAKASTYPAVAASFVSYITDGDKLSAFIVASSTSISLRVDSALSTNSNTTLVGSALGATPRIMLAGHYEVA